MAPRLPLELVERIVEDVAEYDNLFPKSSIKACALVCHSLLPLCRKYIFATVILIAQFFPPTSDDLNHLLLNSPHLNAQLSPPTSDDLNRFLLNSPHLAVYIRKLIYFVNKKEFVTERFSWLIPMFKKLVKLQELSIGYRPSDLLSDQLESGDLDWMSSPERKVLLPLLHLPTLTSISLSSIRNFPLSDLTSCVNLKKLRIQSLECSTPNAVGNFLGALSPTPVTLEQFAIDGGNDNLVQQLCLARRPDGKPIIDFSSLKKIKSSNVRLRSMTELFGMCRNLHGINLYSMSLTRLISSPILTVTLIVEHEYSLDSESRLKGLFIMLKSSLPTLVDISIEYDIDGDGLSDAPLGGLCHEFEKMVGQNVVETIKLKVEVNPGNDCINTRWGELDDVLMGSPEGWPALRKVSLLVDIFGTSNTMDVSYDLAEELRKISMAKLTESERVQFDFQVRVHGPW